jgi:ribosomal protein L7/L12
MINKLKEQRDILIEEQLQEAKNYIDKARQKRKEYY